ACSNPASVTSTSACLIDNVLGCTDAGCKKAAYLYTVTSTGATPPIADYTISANSLGPAVAGKDYCSNTDAVVRFQKTTSTAGTPSAAFNATGCGALPSIQ